MLPQHMKRCSVCTSRKSDPQFIRKEKIYKTCNECSEYCKLTRKSCKSGGKRDISKVVRSKYIVKVKSITPQELGMHNFVSS